MSSVLVTHSHGIETDVIGTAVATYLD